MTRTMLIRNSLAAAAGLTLLAGASMAQGDLRASSSIEDVSGTQGEIIRFRDDKFQVICWTRNDSRSGISCIPEQILQSREVQ